MSKMVAKTCYAMPTINKRTVLIETTIIMNRSEYKAYVHNTLANRMDIV